MGFVDLHVHSNASDGTFSPSQVVELAKNAGLDAFALTDHDTTAGVPEALEKGRDLNIEVIPGIEVSSSFDGTEIHILGLFVDSDDPVLAAMLEKMRISRGRRNEKMLENLAADGISFTKEELCGDNPDTIITRAHIAHALVAKGICSGMDQAFKKYLQYGGRYCPQKEHLSPEEVVKTLISNGAFVALAHPFQYKFGDKKTEELIGFSDYQKLFDGYKDLNKISFDYAVVEKEPDIQVLRFGGQWKDMGTWNTLTEAMEEPSIGEVMLNESCENVHVVNELDVPVLCMGLKNVIVSASGEGILVSDKEQSSYIKPFVDKISQQIMFAEKSWGSFRVLDVEEESMTIKVILNPGHKMNYHSHEHRNEIWNVIAGNGKAILDGREQTVKPGDVLYMPAGCTHTIIADTELKVIESQLGRDITVQDKIKYPMP